MATVRATIEEFARGAWILDADNQESDNLSEISIGGSSWVGTVKSKRTEGAVQKFRMVGGAATLTKFVPSQSFQKRSYQEILSRILANTGLEGAIDSPDRTLPLYCLLGGPLGSVLDQLATTLGYDWWITREGLIRLGTRAAQEITADRIATDIDSVIYFSCTSCDQIHPGYTYQGQTVRHVRWRLTPDRLLAEVAFTDFPRETPSLGYDLTYPAKVLKQDPEQPLLDVLVDGKMGVYAVPLLTAGPFRVMMAAGDLCRVGFENRDPRKPYAFATVQKGSLRVARESDTVDIGSLSFTVPDGPLMWTPPPTESNPVPTPVVVGSSPVSIYGVIDSGSDAVKIP